MQKYVSTNALDRVKTALNVDKHFKPDKFAEVIKYEVLNILKEYADIRNDEFDVKIEVNEIGDYNINITATARRIKIVGIIPDKQQL